MFVLYETPAGYAIFKLMDEKKLSQVDNLYLEFQTPEKAGKLLKLKHFEKFTDTTEALSAGTAAVEGKIAKPLKKTLKKIFNDEVQSSLLVADAKLGNAIKEKFAVQCVYNTGVQELMRCIRQQAESLLGSLPKREMTAMALGLAHSLSRYKLKFSPDKIDTMIVQAQCLLDDLDKELNNYIMRAREWYGWHFPELGKIITDNIAFVKTIKLVGTRDHMSQSDLSDILPEEIEERVKEAAEISMGTEISDEDIMNIQCLCEEILSINDYRGHLYDYLKTRMMAMAPNLTVLVGETVGARLIAHAGSLINLAKHPSSTLQILGAEKALFRALKTKKDTPKYGLIFHAQLVGKASTKNKGKMSRSLAAKASLATRVDAFGEEVTFELGAAHKVKLEARLRLLEEGNLRRLSGTGKAKAKLEKYHAKSEVFTYQPEADNTIQTKKRKFSETNDEEAPVSKKNKKQAETSTLAPEKKKFKKDESDSDSESDSAPPPAKAVKAAPKKPAQDSDDSDDSSSEDEAPQPAKKVSKITPKKPAQDSDDSSSDNESNEAPPPTKVVKAQSKKPTKDSSSDDSSSDEESNVAQKQSKMPVKQTAVQLKKPAKKSDTSSDSDSDSAAPPPAKKVQTKQTTKDSDDSSSDSDSDAAPPAKPASKTQPKKQVQAVKPTKPDTESSSDDDSDAAPKAKTQPKNTVQAAKAKKPNTESSSDDDSDAAPPAKIAKVQPKAAAKDSSSSDDDSDDAPPPAKSVKSQPKKPVKAAESSSDSDSEDEAPPPKKATQSTAVKSKKPVAKPDSDSDSDSDSD